MATLIPLGDASRQSRRFAIVTLLIILTNVYVFLRELVEGDAFVARWALIPANIEHGRNLVTLVTGTFLHADGCTSRAIWCSCGRLGPGLKTPWGACAIWCFT